ncbi:hypothetical protein LCGC14_1907410 [marine sediment metagenome]|uniref:Uncharacterized protein n=1 Tax=marine sediment metagenome TaxID=412755 RepID=A0A0F9GHX6_9ZZZZ
MPKPVPHATPEIKALACIKHRDGETHREIAEQLGISRSTSERWIRDHATETSKESLEQIKEAIEKADYAFLAQSAYIQSLITNTIIKKIHGNELDHMSLQELFRAGVEEAKRYGIRTDKVLMREGGVIPGAPAPSVAMLLSLALSRAEMDRAAAARITAETAAYKASYEDKVVN